VDCPKCGYCLQGHDAWCRCPECGFDCDPHSRALTLPRSPKFQRHVVLGALPLLVGTAGLLLRARQAPDAWLILGIVVRVGYYAIRLFGRRRILVNRHGVQLERRGAVVHEFRWSELGPVALTADRRYLEFTAKDGGSLLRLKLEPWGGEEGAHWCLVAIEAGREAYVTTPTPSERDDISGSG